MIGGLWRNQRWIMGFPRSCQVHPKTKPTYRTDQFPTSRRLKVLEAQHLGTTEANMGFLAKNDQKLVDWGLPKFEQPQCVYVFVYIHIIVRTRTGSSDHKI